MGDNEAKLRIGRQAPAFTLPDITGVQRSLGDFLGKVVVLNFWSAECPWAERTDSVLQQLHKTWGEQVVLLSIASNVHEDWELIRTTASQRQIPYLLVDEQARVADLYRAQTTPHLYVIDAFGILRYQGALDDITFRQRIATKDFLRQAVGAVLTGKDPDPPETPAYGCAIVRPV